MILGREQTRSGKEKLIVSKMSIEKPCQNEESCGRPEDFGVQNCIARTDYRSPATHVASDRSHSHNRDHEAGVGTRVNQPRAWWKWKTRTRAMIPSHADLRRLSAIVSLASYFDPISSASATSVSIRRIDALSTAARRNYDTERRSDSNPELELLQSLSERRMFNVQ